MINKQTQYNPVALVVIKRRALDFLFLYFILFGRTRFSLVLMLCDDENNFCFFDIKLHVLIKVFLSDSFHFVSIHQGCASFDVFFLKFEQA